MLSVPPPRALGTGRAFFDDLLRIVRRNHFSDTECAELCAALEQIQRDDH